MRNAFGQCALKPTVDSENLSTICTGLNGGAAPSNDRSSVGVDVDVSSRERAA
jgi:hypothetical protein